MTDGPDLTDFGTYDENPDGTVAALLLQEINGDAPGDAITQPGE